MANNGERPFVRTPYIGTLRVQIDADNIRWMEKPYIVFLQLNYQERGPSAIIGACVSFDTAVDQVYKHMHGKGKSQSFFYYEILNLATSRFIHMHPSDFIDNISIQVFKDIHIDF